VIFTAALGLRMFFVQLVSRGSGIPVESELVSPGCNIASHLPATAARQPDKAAMFLPRGTGADGRLRWEELSFRELDELSNRYASGLESVGVERGTRTVLMVKPSAEFFGLVFALFKLGAVVVMIDPGMGSAALKKCLRETEPEAFIGIPVAHVARLLFRSSLGSLKTIVTVGTRWFWGGHKLNTLEANSDPAWKMKETKPEEVAAILFTSGSTGIPKGAVYTHGMFDAQVRMLREMYRFSSDEVDLPTFPLFALFDPALGMTAVIPDMDARKPGSADPAKLVDAITAHGCTNMFGSPALLRNLGRYGRTENVQLPTLRRVLSAGAPARTDVLEEVAAMLTDEAQIFTPYGATEALPVAHIGSAEILGETAEMTEQGAGICVGRPVDGAQVRIIDIRDDVIEGWSEELLVGPGEVGEITVVGPMVTEMYWARPERTSLAKIMDGVSVVHRMGDLGYFDEAGRLWMCGRKDHRVTTELGDLFTVPIERMFDTQEGVRQSALVGIGLSGYEDPVLLVEVDEAGAKRGEELVEELLVFAQRDEKTRRVERIVLYPGRFPVDVRHNAKIVRESLKTWADERLS